MKLLAIFTTAFFTTFTVTAVVQAIDTATYDDLFFYYKYASSAYLEACPKPNGNVLISRIDSPVSDTQSFIARDDQKREIIISFRGSQSLEDFFKDGQINLTPFSVANISGPPGAMVHRGFYTAWNSVAADIISIINAQLAANEGYAVVTTGHALGGALSSLAGITLKELLPKVHVRMYTYGQPQTGNKEYADWVDRKFASENLFRSVHTLDPAPRVFPRLILNYTNHGVEYWTFRDPPSARNTKKCALTGDDPKCSSGIKLIGDPVSLLESHIVYFGVQVGSAFCS